MRLRYIGRQGSCRYYWRLLRAVNAEVMYYVIDGGKLAPVANSPMRPVR